MRKQFFTKAKLAIVVAAAAVFAPVAQAAGGGSTAPDLSSLTNAVDFSTTITALLSIAGLLAGVYIAIKGAKTVLGMIRGR